MLISIKCSDKQGILSEIETVCKQISTSLFFQSQEWTVLDYYNRNSLIFIPETDVGNTRSHYDFSLIYDFKSNAGSTCGQDFLNSYLESQTIGILCKRNLRITSWGIFKK